MEDLNGKVAVVTGGASGIGLAMAKAFAAAGSSVVIADIETEPLRAAETQIGGEVLAVQCDVSDPSAVDDLRDAAVERFGTVHVVCNNAGVSAGGQVWTHTPDDWNWVLGVNLLGVVNGIRSFVPLFIEQGEGHVVNTASIAGLTSPPFMGVYNVTKHGVVTLSETLFGDLNLSGVTGVGVSVLCPGWVRTRIHEADRNRPEGNDRGGAIADEGMREVIAGLISGGLDPDDVAAMVLDAVRTRRFYILTHPDWTPMISERVQHIVNGEDPVVSPLPL
ncbi:MAG: SDR family NAD(P)-dependent oxidoreductase [Acidimicrobiales bacterium]|nr:SDR family NAD(P)-dependent oxidoreductase [Acidimicrobiales bacterium]